MSRDSKEKKREKKRLKFVREMRERRNAMKYNPDLIFPRKRDIRFKDSELKE